jgi:hypothetical protein
MTNRPSPLADRKRGDAEGVPFPIAEPITVPEGAKGIHNLFCPQLEECGFYTVSPYTVDEWDQLGREDKTLCPLCNTRMESELIKMPMRVTDKIPIAAMDNDPTGLLGKGRHARWDYSGGAGYYNRKVINKGERDQKAWQKMEQWAKGGSTAMASERAEDLANQQD